MVDFRRLAIAMALLGVLAGLAGAQTLPLTCQTNVAVTPTIRGEGYTEQTGDVTLICTGGSTTTQGAQLPQVNVALFYNTQVTSRLLPVASVNNNISEALLLLDDPGSGVAPYFGSNCTAGSGGPAYANTVGGYCPFGTAANQLLCPTPTSGCVEYATQVFTTGGSATIPANTLLTAASNTFSAVPTAVATAGYNIFQGIVSGNTVSFFGVPILAPVTTGATRTIRITNVRVNATTLGGGSAAGATPVIASISISGATSLQITNATPTVAFVQSGLSASASGVTNLNQCSSQTKASVNTLTFNENFPTAFKTRIFAQANASYAGQAIPGSTGIPNQNVPGQIYNSESNFVLPINSTQTAGLADYGTRLRAIFNNVPAGVRLFVSTTNVFNNGNPVPAPAIVGGSAANTGTTPFAQMVISETVSDGNAGTSGFFPSVPSTDLGPGSSGNVPIAEITPPAGGTATATWELVNTNPNANESVKFAVYMTYTANVAQNSPPPGTATVNLSYAPAPPTISASSAAAASSSLTIPRFVGDSSAARNIATINICRTILLYPYVTNIAGFDTGLAIANTSSDPFGTGAQAGSCALNWYQGTNNPAPSSSGTIAAGTVYTTLASTAVPGFNGYMIAVCNFQFAHGFAFVSDVGARNLAMGYLAIVIADPTQQSNGIRNAFPIGGSLTSSGEQGSH